MTRSRNKKKTDTRRKQTKEVSLLGKAIRSLGALGGSAAGSMVGMSGQGASLGNSLGAALSKWVGAGDYEVSSNSVVSRASQNIPMMHKTDQSVIIRHKEFIAQINGSTAFTVQHSLPLNPGMARTFPWLSSIARNFQEYKFRGVVFHYIPTSGTAVSGTNPALGSVMMQTSYRSQDIAPANKVELLNEYWSSETIPCDTMAHPIECDPKENPFAIHYVRSGPIPSGDYLMYDCGSTHIATAGNPATGNAIGDLWVTYEVELKKPIVTSDVTGAANYYGAEYVFSTVSAPFGARSTAEGNLVVTATGNSITVPLRSGPTVVFIRALSSAGFTASADNCWSSAPTIAGGVADTLDGTNTRWYSLHSSGSVQKTLFYAFAYDSDGSGNTTITLPAINATGTGTVINLIVMQTD